MHQPQASHFPSSMRITPFSRDCLKAFLRHARTHGASSQNLQTTATLTSGCKWATLIRDLRGLKEPSFSNAQMYSQTLQPTHLLGSAPTKNLLEAVFTPPHAFTHAHIFLQWLFLGNVSSFFRRLPFRQPRFTAFFAALFTELQIFFFTLYYGFSSLGAQIAGLFAASFFAQLRNETATSLDIFFFQYCSVCSD